MSHTIIMFLKFGKEEHIQDLFENGTVYINSIQRLRKFEEKELRGDEYEGVSEIKNLPSGEFEIKELNFKGKYISIQIRNAYEEVLGNIYSLFAISSFHTPNPLDFKIDERLAGFGSHCLAIKNNPEFLKRIEKELKKKNLKFRHEFVEYYDDKTTNGKISLFQKRKEYEFQKEFRFYVERDNTEPLIINIGSLKGIAEVYKTEDIINEFQLVPKMYNP